MATTVGLVRFRRIKMSKTGRVQNQTCQGAQHANQRQDASVGRCVAASACVHVACVGLNTPSREGKNERQPWNKLCRHLHSVVVILAITTITTTQEDQTNNFGSTPNLAASPPYNQTKATQPPPPGSPPPQNPSSHPPAACCLQAMERSGRRRGYGAGKRRRGRPLAIFHGEAPPVSHLGRALLDHPSG